MPSRPPHPHPQLLFPGAKWGEGLSETPPTTHRRTAHVHLSIHLPHAHRHTPALTHTVLTETCPQAPQTPCTSPSPGSPNKCQDKTSLVLRNGFLGGPFTDAEWGPLPTHRLRFSGATLSALYFGGKRATKHLQLAQDDESPPVLTFQPRPPPEFLPIHLKQRRPSPRRPRCRRCPRCSPRPEPASGGGTSAWTPGARPGPPPASSSWPEGSSADWEEGDQGHAVNTPWGPPPTLHPHTLLL